MSTANPSLEEAVAIALLTCETCHASPGDVCTTVRGHVGRPARYTHWSRYHHLATLVSVSRLEGIAVGLESAVDEATRGDATTYRAWSEERDAQLRDALTSTNV